MNESRHQEGADKQTQSSTKPKKSPITLFELLPIFNSRASKAPSAPQAQQSCSAASKKSTPVLNPNAADSQRTLVLRRKERTAKKNKLSSLKKLILKDRAERLVREGKAEARSTEAATAVPEANVEDQQHEDGGQEILELSHEAAHLAEAWLEDHGMNATNPDHLEQLLEVLNQDSESSSEDEDEAVMEPQGLSTFWSLPSVVSWTCRRSQQLATKSLVQHLPVKNLLSWARPTAPEFVPSFSMESEHHSDNQVDRLSDEDDSLNTSTSISHSCDQAAQQSVKTVNIGKGSVCEGEGRKNQTLIREYCDQKLSEDLNKTVFNFLSKLNAFQERMKERDPLKAKMKRRVSSGLREVYRSVRIQEAKLVVIAPNIESSPSEGGLDDRVEEIIKAAKSKGIPIVFALSRNRLGKALGKSMRMSAASVHNVDGVHEMYKEILSTTMELREEFRRQSEST
mmetsp:Transcript_25875/g.85226  ORF Transcript_25875/g.85226 Transcript_25875/m.85226 type:complete len:455 (-) Transcript_25875:34-1398(-)